MKATDIPPKARETVHTRDMGFCRRCKMRPQTPHIHHRRSRSVRDEHVHCPCNLVSLCPTCHEHVHSQPFEARGGGFIVSRYATPHETPIGQIVLGCDGMTRTYRDE